MRRFHFSEVQIFRMLKKAEVCRPASDICCENGISSTDLLGPFRTTSHQMPACIIPPRPSIQLHPPTPSALGGGQGGPAAALEFSMHMLVEVPEEPLLRS